MVLERDSILSPSGVLILAPCPVGPPEMLTAARMEPSWSHPKTGSTSLQYPKGGCIARNASSIPSPYYQVIHKPRVVSKP